MVVKSHNDFKSKRIGKHPGVSVSIDFYCIPVNVNVFSSHSKEYLEQTT